MSHRPAHRPDRPARRPTAALRRVRRDARGTSSVEYGLILAFIVLAMFGALAELAGKTTVLWNDISSRVTNAR